MSVIDASVLVEYLSLGEHAEPARERLFNEDEVLWAPQLIDVEVGRASCRERV